jgi:hypothetical protein
MKHIAKLTLLFGIMPFLCSLLSAQTPDSSPAQAQSDSASKKPTKSRPKKTWTDDDINSLRSPVDSYRDQKQLDVHDTANPANSTQASANEPAPNKPPRLSDPKSVESADQMIAWEDRDIAAQEEFVAKLRSRLDTAASEERAHLEDLIVEREKIIADTRKERNGLVAQKKVLEKKEAAAKSAAANPNE